MVENKIFEIDMLNLDLLFVKHDVRTMSAYILETPYEDVKKLIYPHPPYKNFFVLKRNGTPRALSEPRLPLKLLQKKLLSYLKLSCSPFRAAVHGFVENRSILTNARQHCLSTQHQLLNLDLQDFFPSITFYRVRGVFQSHPFNFSYEVATVLAHLCTYNGVLPQGAPTSPFLANLVCRGLDRDLMELARRCRAIYTRYADDITFSFNVRSPERLPSALCSVTDGQVAVGAELGGVIHAHSFSINPSKTRLQNRSKRMEVTGLTINVFPNVRRRFVDKIRGALHAWEKYGYDAASVEWIRRAAESETPYESRPWKRQTRNCRPAELKNVIWGKLLYLRMVRGGDDILYARLADRFNYAVDRERAIKDFPAPHLPVEPVVRSQSDIGEGVFVLEWLGDYRIGSLSDLVCGQGSAFVYRELNLLVTCDHVLQGEYSFGSLKGSADYQSPDMHNQELKIVHASSQISWPAKILFRDRQLDVALISFDTSLLPRHRYFRARGAPIKRGEDGYLIGFPNYQNGKAANVLKDKVLNRTFPNKNMASFTVENAGSIRPGNSGGPFTDNSFEVAGLAQRGAFLGSGDDECLCFTVIDQVIDRWKLSLANARALSKSAFMADFKTNRLSRKFS